MHDKGGVHGCGPWQGAASPKLEKPPSSQDGGPTLLGLGRCPTVTSPLERSGRWSPYHRNGNSCSSFAWCSVIDCFIHESGNCGAVITVLWRARDSAGGAEPMCALSRRQSLLRGEGTPRGWRGPRRGWRPRRAFGLILAEHPRCPLEERSLAREKTFARLARLGEPGP